MATGYPVKQNFAAGDILTATQMNDLSGTVNFAVSATPTTGTQMAGKNKLINGDCTINQRSFTSSTTTGTYGFDRQYFTTSDGTVTYSAQTFTPGTAPVTGYEAKNYARIVTTGQTLTTAFSRYRHSVENVRNYAAQTTTFSFWAKAATGTPKIAVELTQSFGTGGSPSGNANLYIAQVTLSTSWARYSVTVNVPSISGKTIGTTDNTSQLWCEMWLSAGSSFDARTGTLGIQSNTFDMWGFQWEPGSTATAFQTASGSPQAELAMCQRYYQLSDFYIEGYNIIGGTTGQQSYWKVNTRTTPTIAFTTAPTLNNVSSYNVIRLTAFGGQAYIINTALGGAYGFSGVYSVSAEL
jgi:hypothetical protein